MNNLNYHCMWRIEIAKQVCEKIKNIEGIEAIIVGGSAARGYADEYSDVEIPIFWKAIPDENVRKFIVKELNAEYFYPYNYEAREIDEAFKNDSRIITLRAFPKAKNLYKAMGFRIY